MFKMHPLAGAVHIEFDLRGRLNYGRQLLPRNLPPGIWQLRALLPEPVCLCCVKLCISIACRKIYIFFVVLCAVLFAGIQKRVPLQHFFLKLYFCVQVLGAIRAVLASRNGRSLGQLQVVPECVYKCGGAKTVSYNFVLHGSFAAI